MQKFSVRVFSILLILAILSQNKTVSNRIKAINNISQISISGTDCEQDEYTYLNISASGLTDLASIGLVISYDPDVFELIDAYGISSEAVINTGTDGEFSANMIFPDGISGSVNLLQFCLKVKPDATADTYPVALTVKEAKNKDSNDVEIAVVNGSVTVKEKINALPVINFGGYSNKSSGYFGEEITYTFFGYDWKDLSKGEFLFTYDPGIFEFVSLEFSDNADETDIIDSENGRAVKVSYDSPNGIEGYQKFVLKLKIIADRNLDTNISFSAENLYDKDLQEMHAESVDIETSTIRNDYPDVRFDTETTEEGNYRLYLILPGESNIAAGTFTVSYDKLVFDCLSVNEHSDVADSGSVIVIDPDIYEGVIVFTFENEEGLNEDLKVLEIILQPKGYTRTTVTVTGIDVTDKDSVRIELDYIDSVITISLPVFIVTWDVDGVVTEEEYEYGETPEFKGSTDKAPTEMYTYIFTGWDKEISEVTGDITYTAQYSSEIRKYTVTWDVDGTEITEEYEYGALPEFKGSIDKEPDGDIKYRFTGWDKEIEPVTGDVTYIAQYVIDVETYIVAWHVDGVITYETYVKGEIPSFKGSTEKTPTAVYTYEFIGWDKELTEVTKNVTYIAQYKTVLRKYTITWIVGDGEVTEEYEYGIQPVFTGSTDKTPDARYTYEFTGWDKEIVTVTEDVTYTAQYLSTVRRYTVTWDVDGVVTEEEYEYGEMPVFTGSTDKSSTEMYIYEFTGWDTEITSVTGDITYTAQYQSIVRKYTVTWIVDGAEIPEEYEYGSVPDFKGSTDKEPEGDIEYTFTGWDKEITVVTEDITYTAIYSAADTKAPVVTGIEDGKHYNTDVTIDFNEGNATLNGEAFEKGSTISEEGIYTLIVTDEAGNVTEVNFAIDKTAPVISVRDKDSIEVGNNGVSFTEVTVTADDDIIIMFNGNIIGISDTYSSTGIYIITARDIAGNETVYTFEIKGKTVTSDDLNVNEEAKLISKIQYGMTIAEFLSKINEGASVKVFKDNTEVSGNTLIGTGMTVKLMDGDNVISTYTVVVTGDLNGDGNSSLTDFVLFRSYLLGTYELKGAFARAADLNGDGNVTLTDFVEYKAVMLGNKSIVAY